MHWRTVVLTAALVVARTHALDCRASTIVHSPAYTTCQSATAIDFTVAGKATFMDPAVFCGNGDCIALWDQLQRLGALQCLQQYSAGSYALMDERSAQSCFKTYATVPSVQSVTQQSRSLSQAAPSSRDTNATDSKDSSSGASLESATISPPSTTTSVSIKTHSDLEGTSLSAVWIALGSCGGGIVLLIVVAVYIRRRKARNMEAKVLECLEHNTSSGHYRQTTPTSRSLPVATKATAAGSISTQKIMRPSPRLICLDDDIITAVRIPYGKLTIGSLVSRGGFGEVYRGMYRNKSVAIKRLLPEKRNDAYQIENFLDEAKVMASLDHDHIVHFVGVAWETIEELCVVTEFMALGDLRTLLGKYDVDEDAHPKGFDAEKLKIAVHVAKALSYMHSLAPSVLHRDIKSRNILLDTHLNAKVTDFGVSRERAESTMTTGVGSTLWMAPEVMAGGRYNEKADVFSFGVVLSELDTHRIPYSHAVDRGRRLPDTVVVQMMTMDRIRVEFTNELASPVAQLGRQCVHLDPSKRPTAKEVEALLEAQLSVVGIAL